MEKIYKLSGDGFLQRLISSLLTSLNACGDFACKKLPVPQRNFFDGIY